MRATPPCCIRLYAIRVYIRCSLIRCITRSTGAIDPRWLLRVVVTAASGKKRKRVVLTIEEKLKICDLMKNGRSLTSVAAEFNVGKSTVHGMMKNKAKLQTFLTVIQDGDCINKKRQIVRRANLDALDKAVYLWFVQQRCKEPRSVVHYTDE